MKTHTRRWATVGMLVGAVGGGLMHWVYMNTAPMEIHAARTDGFPLWSTYQLPFAIPGVLFGGVLGLIVGLCVAVARRAG